MKRLISTLCWSLLLPISAVQSQVLSDQVAKGEPLMLTVGVSGEVAAVMVGPGDRVNKGDVLLRLNQSVFKAKLQAASLLVELRKSQANLLESDYERQQELYAEGSLSTVQLEEIEAAWLQARAMLSDALAEKVLAQRRLALTEINAPSDGEVIAVAYVGQRVNVTAKQSTLIKLKPE